MMDDDTNENENAERKLADVFKSLDLMKKSARALLQEPDKSDMISLHAATIKVSPTITCYASSLLPF
jgi:hypothetical protein